MPNKFVCIKELKSDMTKTSTPKTYRQVFDQDNYRWNLFENMPAVELNHCYIFAFESENGFNNVKQITPVINIFKQEALKEITSKNDVKRELSIALSYSVSLMSAGKLNDKVELFSMAYEMYDWLNSTADKLMPKEEGVNKNANN